MIGSFLFLGWGNLAYDFTPLQGANALCKMTRGPPSNGSPRVVESGSSPSHHSVDSHDSDFSVDQTYRSPPRHDISASDDSSFCNVDGNQSLYSTSSEDEAFDYDTFLRQASEIKTQNDPNTTKAATSSQASIDKTDKGFTKKG